MTMHIPCMRSLHLPQTRANVAAQSGEWCALFDCLDCAEGVYMPGETPTCMVCGATAPAFIAKVMADVKARRAA